MKKLLLVPALLVSFLASVSAFAVEGLAVIDMRTAVLATQVSKATFTALEEESEYAGNVSKHNYYKLIVKPLLKNFKKMVKLFHRLKLLRCKKIFRINPKT